MGPWGTGTLLACVALTACDAAQVTSDAGADCQPFALIPDATVLSCTPVDGGPACVGDLCRFEWPYACEGGLLYPLGCTATLSTTSASDLNCRNDNSSENHCLCEPQTCTCSADNTDSGGRWACPL